MVEFREKLGTGYFRLDLPKKVDASEVEKLVKLVKGYYKNREGEIAPSDRRSDIERG